MKILIALAIAGLASTASAQEPPVSWTAGEPSLKWAPCPPFLPKGCEIAVLRGNPARPNVDIFFKVPAKASIPRHWHTSAERMVLVAGELHVTYDGHNTAVLKQGSYAYGPAKLPHKAECKDAGPCILFIAFEAPLDALEGGKEANR